MTEQKEEVEIEVTVEDDEPQISPEQPLIEEKQSSEDLHASQSRTTTSSSPEDNSLFSYTWLTILILGNIGCSVGLILVNKTLMQNFDLKFVLLVTTFHFGLPGIILEVALHVSKKNGTPLFEAVDIPMKVRLTLATLNVLSIATMNLSLQANSVGFYQITKLLCIPCMIMIQGVVWKDFVSSKIKVTLLILLAGVGITTVTDLKLNLVGTLWGAVAVLTTTLCQIYTGKVQSEHKVKPTQLLHSIMLIQCGIMFTLALPLEVIPQALATTPKSESTFVDLVTNLSAMGLIVLSCIIAAGVNFFTIAMIGATSAITYQVVGHLKTCLILVFGFILFPVDAPLLSILKNVFGVCVALLGVITYGEVKRTEKIDSKQPQDFIDELVLQSQDALKPFLPPPSAE